MSRRSKQKHDRRTLRQKISLRKILRFLFSRMVIVGVLIFLQLAFLVALLVTLEGHPTRFCWYSAWVCPSGWSPARPTLPINSAGCC